MQPELKTLDPDALAARCEPLQVQPGVVHVWAFSLEGSTECIVWCRQRLTDEERQRADRFVFEHHRNQHVIAHGLLRHLLARYCGVDPLELSFTKTATGKPVLRTRPADGTALSFSLTHSYGRALVAVSDGREVGIDLERVRPDTDTLAIARRYFFGSELRDIEQAPPHARREVFFRYWVAKEAVLKAQGVGLGFPLDRFQVRFEQDRECAHVVSFDAARLAADWTVRMLSCEPGWLGAVAARGDKWQLRIRP